MAVVTTLSMPPLLRRALTRLPLSSDEAARLEREEIEERGFVPNIERLLVAVDASPSGLFASRLAGLLARTWGAPTTVIHFDYEPEDHSQEGTRQAERTKTVVKRVRRSAKRLSPSPTAGLLTSPIGSKSPAKASSRKKQKRATGCFSSVASPLRRATPSISKLCAVPSDLLVRSQLPSHAAHIGRKRPDRILKFWCRSPEPPHLGEAPSWQSPWHKRREARLAQLSQLAPRTGDFWRFRLESASCFKGCGSKIGCSLDQASG